MKISKITIKSLFGIKEWSGDGKNIELVGDNGTGKTSVIDAIRYALTNASDREYIIKNGETEGEIFIETDSGLSIDRNEVRAYKKYVRKFPHKQILGVMGYEVINYDYLEYSEEDRQPVSNLFGE